MCPPGARYDRDNSDTELTKFIKNLLVRYSRAITKNFKANCVERYIKSVALASKVDYGGVLEKDESVNV